jgi:hypothetical protein
MPSPPALASGTFLEAVMVRLATKPGGELLLVLPRVPSMAE